MKKNTREKRLKMRYDIPWKIVSTIVFHITLVPVTIFVQLAFSLRTRGKKNLRKAKKAVLVSNHTLLMDPAVLSRALYPFRTYFTLLQETILAPVLGTYLRMLGGIPVSPTVSGVKRLRGEISLALENRRFVHLFPEGECYQWNQQINEYRPGAFEIAREMSVPIIPVTTVLHGRKRLNRFLERLTGRSNLYPPAVTLVIGVPYEKHLESDRNSPGVKQFSSEVREIMQAVIDTQDGSKSISRGKMKRIVK
jgi:1-acyl-sn-glycerol-3-phosphate acyltransferase